MVDSIGLYGDSDSSVSSEDTGKGKKLKTGNLKRSYNMATCPKGQVYDQKLKECRVANHPHKKAQSKRQKKKLREEMYKAATREPLGKP